MLCWVSKAFTSEETAEAPLLVPARAPLPPGVVNYVTPRGHARLEQELVQLREERARLAASAPSSDLAPALQSLATRIAVLSERLAAAVPVHPATQRPEKVRFGAVVTVRDGAGSERRFQIVGVDEANAAERRVAFVAPLARAVLGKRIGDVVTLRTPRSEDELEVVGITYEG